MLLQGRMRQVWVCRFVKDADKAIVAELKSASRLVDSQMIVHSYPFCWRSETPLIYKAGPGSCRHFGHWVLRCIGDWAYKW